MTIFCSCKKPKDNSISIDIYKTEATDKLYKIILRCDTLTNLFLHQHPIDTNALSISEQLELGDGVSKSHYCSIRSNPILGRLAFVYEEDTGRHFKFCSSAIFGTADCSDTSKINNWLASKDCFTDDNQKFIYKWLTDSNNLKEASLIGLKSNQPVLTLHYSDLDSVKLTPILGLTGLINLFTNEKTEPESYYLDIVLKQTALNSIRSQIQSDSTSGYLAVIQSGTNKYFYTIKRKDIKKTNTLDKITIIDTKDIDEYIDKFGTDITKTK